MVLMIPLILAVLQIQRKVVVVKRRNQKACTTNSKPKSSHKSKTPSIPQDSKDISPPPQPTIPRSVIYRIHANLRLKPSVTPVVVDFDNLILGDCSQDRINWVKKRCFTEGTLTAHGISNVVGDAIEGNSHILQDAEWESDQDAIYYCKSKRSSTDDVLNTRNKEFCMFGDNDDVKDYMGNYAYYPKSETNKSKVYIDVFLLLRKSKPKKRKPTTTSKKKKKENLILPTHIVIDILAPVESYHPNKGACPEIKTSKMQVIDGLTMDYTHWTRDYDEDLDDDDDVYLLMNKNENIDDNNDENEEANIQKKVVFVRIGDLKNNILYKVKESDGAVHAAYFNEDYENVGAHSKMYYFGNSKNPKCSIDRTSELISIIKEEIRKKANKQEEPTIKIAFGKRLRGSDVFEPNSPNEVHQYLSDDEVEKLENPEYAYNSKQASNNSKSRVDTLKTLIKDMYFDVDGPLYHGFTTKMYEMMVKHMTTNPKYGQCVFEWENNLPKSRDDVDIMVRVFRSQFYQKELGKLIPEKRKYPPTIQGDKEVIPEHPKNLSKQNGTSGMSDFQANMINVMKSSRAKDLKDSIDGLLGCDKLLRNSENLNVTTKERKRMVRYSNKLRELVYSDIRRQHATKIDQNESDGESYSDRDDDDDGDDDNYNNNKNENYNYNNSNDDQHDDDNEREVDDDDDDDGNGMEL